jgi:MurNAc alpha-1-phosphate uridylyltransferase
LLPVRGRPLIEWHLAALAAGGVKEVVVNVAWLGQQLVDAVGASGHHGLQVRWSREDLDPGHALETAGGIATALPLLGLGADEVFWVVSGDVFMPGFGYSRSTFDRFCNSPAERDAHLWLVPNPDFHPSGDFGLSADGSALPTASAHDGRTWTYANVALVRPRLFATVARGQVAKLAPLLVHGMQRGRISAEVWPGEWHNVGTPAQWAALQSASAAHAPMEGT